MIRIYNLQKAGYPFQADDLEVEEWEDLAKVKSVYEVQQFCPFMKKRE